MESELQKKSIEIKKLQRKNRNYEHSRETKITNTIEDVIENNSTQAGEENQRNDNVWNPLYYIHYWWWVFHMKYFQQFNILYLFKMILYFSGTKTI